MLHIYLVYNIYILGGGKGRDVGLSNFRSDDDISFDPMKIARL